MKYISSLFIFKLGIHKHESQQRDKRGDYHDVNVVVQFSGGSQLKQGKKTHGTDNETENASEQEEEPVPHDIYRSGKGTEGPGKHQGTGHGVNKGKGDDIIPAAEADVVGDAFREFCACCQEKIMHAIDCP